MGVEDRHYFNLALCWTLPHIPSEPFHLFYLFKVAAHVEDVLFLAWTWAYPPSAQEEENRGRDAKMVVHHLSTAALCVCSYYSGYAKIGANNLHDSSKAPNIITQYILSAGCAGRLGDYVAARRE